MNYVENKKKKKFIIWEKLLPPGAQILWVGQSKPVFTIRFLEQGYYGDKNAGFDSIVIGYLILALLLCTELMLTIGWLFATIIFLAIIVYPLISEWIAYRRKNITSYALTDQGVYFTNASQSDAPVVCLPYAEIIYPFLVRNNYSSYSIQLLMGERHPLIDILPSNSTLDGFPAIEFIQKYEEAIKIIKQKIPVQNRRKLKYRKPKATRSQVKLLRQTMLVLSIFFSAYLLDYYVVPVKHIQDQVVMIEKMDTESKALGWKYHTKKNYRFSTTHGYPELKTDQLNLTATRIFRNVHSLQTKRMDYSPYLHSSFKSGIMLGAYLLAYVVVVGSWCILQGKTTMDKETYWEIIITAGVYLSIFWVAWAMLN